MTIIPDKDVTLAARTSADFEEVFEVDGDVSDGEFRFVVKRDVLDADTWLDADAASGIEATYEAEDEITRVTVFIERETLVGALGADEKRVEGIYELQWTGPDDLDGVWLSGKFVLTRGL